VTLANNIENQQLGVANIAGCGRGANEEYQSNRSFVSDGPVSTSQPASFSKLLLSGSKSPGENST